MIKSSQVKESLEHAWASLSEGWRDLRERTSGALTRFTGRPLDRDDHGGEVPLGEEPFTGRWGLLAADVFDDDDKLVVRVEVPGMRKEDLGIEVRGDTLLVHGHKRFERERSQGHYRLMQCSYGSFRRAVELPVPVRADKATASCRDGVLRIELPKQESVRRHRIQVRTA